MSITLIIVIALVAVGLIGLGVMFLTMSGGSGESGGFMSQQSVKSNLRTLVAAQREQTSRLNEGASKKDKKNLAFAAAAESELSQKKTSTTSRMTLEKKLRFAKWPITPIQFRAIQVLVTTLLFIPAYAYATIFIQLLVLFMGPAIVMSALDRAMNIRFELFDEDYPVMLLSYVSLLKTGMSAIQGLEAASKGLDEDSLVRTEVELLVERLRLGLTEEQAIGAFGEDIAHPEIELFVQCLILSRRVGGTLSNTLDRLAKQVRKRQQFRRQAVAAVGMERSSLYVVAAIMGALMCYITWASPVLVLPALSHPIGKKVFQGGIMLIVFGFYWSRKVTDIKI